MSEGRTDNLLRMLDDPLNYGLFPDNYCLVLMLDHFLKQENWRDASKAGRHLYSSLLVWSNPLRCLAIRLLST